MNPKKDPAPWRPPDVGDPADPLGFTRAIADYLEARAMRGDTQHTLHGKAKDLEYFLRWAEPRGLIRPADITRPILERYQRTLFYYRKKNGRPLAFSTQRHRLTVLRSLFGFLARANRILYNPASDLDLPRLRERLPPPVLSSAEIEQVLALPDVTDVYGLRDRALLETFYSTAMRRSELAHLKLPELDFSRGTVTIRSGKGGKDRVVPIGERALAWLERYLAESRPRLVIEPDEGFLFLTYLGQSFDPDHLSYLVARFIDQADLGKSGSCHLIRHSVATLMLEHGADCRYVQELLGHSQLSTTQICLQVTITRLKAVHAATHPGALLKPPRPPDQSPTAAQVPTPARDDSAPNTLADLPQPGCVDPSLGYRVEGLRRVLLAALDQEADDDAPERPDPGGPI
ncbi:MAG: site-specific tyrosine recombinase XerC [Candidatus Riflebacteria bacterium]|nr:site-specific tyrosine recombinase XerC [Candidatus Riflebacteria bacterium]